MPTTRTNETRREAMPMEAREARFQPDTLDAEARTIEVVWTTGARVLRRRFFSGDFEEELAVDNRSVRLDRLNDGAAVLDSHDNWELRSQIGVVERAWLENGEGRAVLRVSNREEVAGIWRDIQDGIIRNISVGYAIHRREITERDDGPDLHRITDWEPMEISFVSIPADAGAGVRSAADRQERLFPQEIINRASAQTQESIMTEEVIDGPEGQTTEPGNSRTQERAPESDAPAPETAGGAQSGAGAEEARRTERQRISDLTDIARRASMDDVALRQAIDGDVTVDAFRTQAFDHLAGQSQANPTSTIRISREEVETRAESLEGAIVARMTGGREVEGAAREYMNYSLAEMAAEAIGHRGQLRTANDRIRVLERAFDVRAYHSVTDFPAIFENAMHRILLMRYEQSPATYRRIAARRDFSDFRPHPQVRAGDFPALQKIAENGEIKSGTFSESKETAFVVPYGVKFHISRQMIVNDDLGQINQVVSSAGDRVADHDNTVMYTLLLSGSGAGPTLLTDNKRVFHADHGNLAGAGGAPSTTTIGAGRAAMMKQESLDKLKLNVAPSIILGGPDTFTVLEQVTASIQPIKEGEVNPFSGRLDPLGDANITGNAWYLFASPDRLPCFTYGYLDGSEGPRLRTDEPFGMQGLGVSLEHDFGAAGIDFRGAYRNPGA